MKHILAISLCCFIILISCDTFDFNSQYVKLNATINDSAETIHLGDTLKIKLTIPDTLEGVGLRVPVNSLQTAWYGCTFYYIDTIAKMAIRITSQSNIFPSKGTYDGYSPSVTTSNKPFVSTLNLVPPTRGFYYFQVTPEAGTIKVNDSYKAGLIVNIGVRDKHWTINNGVFAWPNVNELDNAGFAFYCFRVD